MNTVNEVRKRLDELRKTKEEAEREKAGRALADCLISIAEENSITEESLEDIRLSMEFFTTVRRHFIGDELAEELKYKITDTFVNCTKDKKRRIAKRILYARALVSSIKGQEAIDIAEELNLSNVSRVYYPAMEAEADHLPSEGLMDWYAEFLSRNLSYKTVAAMFNRLAYYWLNAYRGSNHTDRAKAYFLAMERRGILPKNPYGDGYGDGNCEELIEKLLKDEYEDGIEKHINYCISFLVKELSEGRDSLINTFGLERNMHEMFTMFFRGDKDINMELWDQTLIEYCETLKKCCENADDEHMAGAAEKMVSCLADSDNWLLRYIEIENKEGTTDSYYEKIKEWIVRIEKLSPSETWAMMDSLQGLLVGRYLDLDDKGKLIEALDEMTSTTDTVAYMGDYYEDSGNVRYCTLNTIALLKLLIEEGREEEARSIIKEIGEVPKDNESWWGFDNSHGLWTCWMKYICFLEEYGFTDEISCWKDKLKEQFFMTDNDIEWELAYIKGDYKAALNFCEKSLETAHDRYSDQYGNENISCWNGWGVEDVPYKSRGEKKMMIEMLRYIIDGTFPSDIDSGKVEVLSEKPADSVHCRGSISFHDRGRHYQYSNEEWHKFSATSGTMAEIFRKGLRESEQPTLYPEDYYKVMLTYEPEPAFMRGDYIKYLYEKHGRDWFGFQREDLERIIDAT